MNITVRTAEGLPEKAYVSIRAGEVRKQMQYKPGEKLFFDVKSPPRHFSIDVFEKVGSVQVSTADLLESGQSGTSLHLTSTRTGAPMNLDLSVEATDGLESGKRKLSRHQAALEAKNYLESQGIQSLLQGMVQQLLASQPADALAFMNTFIEENGEKFRAQAQLRQSLAPPGASKSNFAPANRSSVPTEEPYESAHEPGLGSSEYPGFPVDGSAPLPDLSGHCSVVAKLLAEHPEIYTKVQDVRTPNGVSAAQCIKPGIDVKGYRTVKSLGIVAGDEYCYDVFQEIFNRVLLTESSWTGEEQPLGIAVEQVKEISVLESQDYVIGVQVIGHRNLRGIRMPTAASLEERIEVERLLTTALATLEADLQGEYFPLLGSKTHGPKPGGASDDDWSLLKVHGLAFEMPDSASQLASGIGRHWPEARGLFASEDYDLACWINEDDHLRILCRQSGHNLKQTLSRFARFEGALETALQDEGFSFAKHQRLGFLTTNPAFVGCGVQVSVQLRLPRLGVHGDFQALCRQFGLQAVLSRNAGSGVWEVQPTSLLGLAPDEIANLVLDGCNKLIDYEIQLEGGTMTFQTVPEAEEEEEEEDVVLPPIGKEKTMGPEMSTIASECYVDEGFPVDECPPMMPDLSSRHNVAADVLQEDPSIWDLVKDKRTPLGVSFAACIKTGIDNGGHPMIKTMGAVAADEYCYETFKEFFDPLIQRRHPDHKVHGDVSDLDWTKVVSDCIDPSGKKVVAVRACVSRNLSGLRMLPACSFDERRAAEAALVQALLALSGDFQGDYFPLADSTSYDAKPGGLSPEEEDAMRAERLLFEEPDSAVRISAGYARDWPDGRGVFVAESRSIAAWINEVDHLRLTAMESGCDLKHAFERLTSALSAIEAELKALGYSFSKSENYGFLGSCPSNVGTCLSASVTLRLPKLSSHPHFRTLCRELKLQAHLGLGSSVGAGKGIWEVYNASRLGSTEVEQVSQVIEASRLLLHFEDQLSAGEDISRHLEEIIPAVSETALDHIIGLSRDPLSLRKVLTRTSSLMAQLG